MDTFPAAGWIATYLSLIRSLVLSSICFATPVHEAATGDDPSQSKLQSKLLRPDKSSSKEVCTPMPSS